MEAGAALFLERGSHATTIDGIATAAGIAKGTFHLHFSSIEELLAALREAFVALYLDLVEALPARAEGGRGWRVPGSNGQSLPISTISPCTSWSSPTFPAAANAPAKRNWR